MPQKPKKAEALGKQPVKKKAPNKLRGYGTAHQKMREYLLNKYPVCVCCNNAFSKEAHHLRYGDNLTEQDYLAVCGPCHHKLENDKNR